MRKATIEVGVLAALFLAVVFMIVVLIVFRGKLIPWAESLLNPIAVMVSKLLTGGTVVA